LAYVKLIAVIALLGALYVLARLVTGMLARRNRKRQQGAPRLQSLRSSPPLLTGSDFKLISTALEEPEAPRLPPLAAFSIAGDSLCVPPRILNYHFRHTDALRGPADPRAFCDEFFVEMEDGRSGRRYTQQFTVATAEGLARLMREDHLAHLFAEDVLLVSTFNLGEILTAIAARYADWRGATSSARETLTR